MSQQSSLSVHDFADRIFKVAPGQVTSVLVDGERVWVTIEDQPGAAFTLVEAKNIEDVTAWADQTEKLEDFVVLASKPAEDILINGKCPQGDPEDYVVLGAEPPGDILIFIDGKRLEDCNVS